MNYLHHVDMKPYKQKASTVEAYMSACESGKVEEQRYIQIAGMRSFSPAVCMIPLDTTTLLEQVVLPLSIKIAAVVSCLKIQWRDS